MTREPKIPMSPTELPQQQLQTQRHPSRPSPSGKYPHLSGDALVQLQKHMRGGFQTSLLARSPKQPDEGDAS
jgi:hypothetical protein